MINHSRTETAISRSITTLPLSLPFINLTTLKTLAHLDRDEPNVAKIFTILSERLKQMNLKLLEKISVD